MATITLDLQKLTVCRHDVEPEVVLAQFIILDHAAVDGLHHSVIIAAELVVGQTYLFQALCNGNTLENFNYSCVP